jgi:uncharacterized protein (TIGR02145 family)
VTAPPFTCGTSTISDIDGNSYNTVLIGTQCWTKENLKVTRYNDGTAIPDNTTAGWGSSAEGSRSDYTGAVSYITNYGYLYNWFASKGIATSGSITYKNLCPTGSHVPTHSDWNKLVIFIHSGADTTISGTQSTSAGTLLKKNDALWTSNIGTNTSGFSALPGGYRDFNGGFNNIRDLAFFWSATNSSTGEPWLRSLSDNVGSVQSYNNFSPLSGLVGASVRCLRD